MKQALFFLFLLSFGALFSQENAAKTIKTYTYGVTGMTCRSCVDGIETKMKKVDGVKSIKVDYEKKSVTIEVESKKISEEDLEKRLKKTGYGFKASKHFVNESSAFGAFWNGLKGGCCNAKSND